MQKATDPSYHKTSVNVITNEATSGGEFALLGSNTKFASPPPIENVIIRYFLQAEARRLLPTNRVRICHRVIVPDKTFLDVMYSPLVGKAHYKNLMHCDSVWICPVCASKITERRREELTAALEATELTPVLITYTLRHNAGDSLITLLSGILKSFHNLKSGKAWKKRRSKYGWLCSIRALEVTHGENGWHPHIHELVLLETPLTPEIWGEMLIFIRQRWQRTLIRAGRDAAWDYGVDMRETREYIQEYLAKFGHQPVTTGWTIEQELTKAPVKRSKGDGGRSPHQLLADSAAGDLIAGKLFIEYAKCFRGKQQLVWSKGLRELMGLDGPLPTDAEIAAADSSNAFLLAQLNKDQWDIILGNDARGELLKIANQGDWAALRDWLVDFGITLDF